MVSHLSSWETRLTSTARLTSGTFRSNKSRGTALTSGSLLLQGRDKVVEKQKLVKMKPFYIIH